MEEGSKHIKISEFNYLLLDERITKFLPPVRDQSKLLLYRHGEVFKDVFTSLSDYLPAGSLMTFNSTKVIQACLHFRKETGALIEVLCFEPTRPSDYVLNFQQAEHAAWPYMIGNLKKWKKEALKREIIVKGKPLTLTTERGTYHGTSHRVDSHWNGLEITFVDIPEIFGELPIPSYLNRETQGSDEGTYRIAYSKIKDSVAAPTAGLCLMSRVLDALCKKGAGLEGLTLHVGAGIFKSVKSEEIEGHEMHTGYISASRNALEKLIAHEGKAAAVGMTPVCTLESLYHIGITLLSSPNATEEELRAKQRRPYELTSEMASVLLVDALQAIVAYPNRHNTEILHTNAQTIIVPGYKCKIVKATVANLHQPQSTLPLLISAFLHGDWRKVYDYTLAHDFRSLSYGDSSLPIP